MNAKYTLRWEYSPPDYFEQEIRIQEKEFVLTADNGIAEAVMDCDVFDRSPTLESIIQTRLNNCFRGSQIVSRNPFQLSQPAGTRLHADGRKDVYIKLTGVTAVAACGTVDVRYTTPDGTKVDTRRDRLEQKKRYALAAATHSSDPTLSSILSSLDASTREPQVELVRLYEIRDALLEKFGSETAAKYALRISAADCSKLGHLCNDSSIRQGRHIGKSGGALRDATETELVEARNIAQGMAEKYLNSL